MFGKNKQPGIRSLISAGTRLQGRLEFEEGLRIDGQITGDVIASNDSKRSIVVIGDKGVVVGEVRASHVIINGAVQGPVHASELLELQPKASIDGDVNYATLEMHQGATISGQLKPLKQGDKPALKLASNNE